MEPGNRKIDDFIENKLRQASLARTRSDFTGHLMKRIESEYTLSLQEARSDRIAKYIIGSFSSLILVVTILIGYLAKSDVSSKIESTGITIQPTIETSANYFQQFLTLVQNFFVDVLAFLGLSVSLQTVNIVAGLLVVFTFFFLADKIFFKGKLRSIHS